MDGDGEKKSNLPRRWGSVTGQNGFVYTISLRVGVASTRPTRMLVRPRGCGSALTSLSLFPPPSLSLSIALSLSFYLSSFGTDVAAHPSPNVWREPCGTSEARLGGLHTSSDARPIWLARHWQEPSHESR